MASNLSSNIGGSRVGRWVRRFLESRLSNYYEGPEPPVRLAEMVVWFSNANPNATREQWATFASLHAAEAYRSGYVRGYENSERDPEEREYEPEDVADAMYPDWRWQEGIRLDGNPIDQVPDEPPSEQQEILTIQEMLRRHNERGG